MSDTKTWTIKAKEIDGLLDGPSKLTPSLKLRLLTAIANVGAGKNVKLVLTVEDEGRLQSALAGDESADERSESGEGETAVE